MSARRHVRPDRSLSCERLEDRTTPALFGNPWPNADNLTLSFVPDGTDVAGVQSNLHAKLNSELSPTVWQKEIGRAFQSWAQHANLNFAVVGDNGKPIGEPGPIQGSGWFGDIRISARPFSDNVLAVSTPFDLLNSWAGEIVINSNKSFGQGNVAGKHDIYTVVLQEAGHALGLDNSPDTAAAMFTNYSTARSGLAASDVQAIQRMYGARSADKFDLNGANETIASADPIAFVVDDSQLAGTDGTRGSTPLVAAGDLTTLAVVDFYSYKLPSVQSDFRVAILTEGISQLRAKVTVYDSANKVVATAVATPEPGKPFELFVGNAKAGATYRVKVEGATNDVFGIGAYRLAVGKEAKEAVVPPPVSGYINQDGHKNDSISTATDLGGAKASTDLRWDATYTGSIFNANKTDLDFYKIRTQKDTPNVMVVAVWAGEAGKLNPKVEVFDAAGKLVAAEVLSSTGSYVVIQVIGVVADKDYFVRVGAKDPTDSFKEGNYTLAVDFRASQVELTTFASGTLQGTTNQAVTSFTLTRTQSLWFEVSGQVGVNASVRLTVYDSNNVAVFTIKAKGGETAGGDVLLDRGSYTVRFTAAGANGAPLPAFDFRGRFSLGSDPIGPGALAPTEHPAGGTPAPQPEPDLWNYDEFGNPIDFLGASGVFAGPTANGTTGVLLWKSASPRPDFFTATLGDLYSDPWW